MTLEASEADRKQTARLARLEKELGLERRQSWHELPPAQLIVGAGELHMYAWNEAGICLGHCGLRMVAQSFMEHPRLSDLVDLDYALWHWVQAIPAAHARPGDWREFHVQGLILAQRMAELLRAQQIPVFYNSRGADPALLLLHTRMGPL